MLASTTELSPALWAANKAHCPCCLLHSDCRELHAIDATLSHATSAALPHRSDRLGPAAEPETTDRLAKAEVFVTEQAPDFLKEIVMKRTPLGEDARRNNARTGGSVALEHVTLDKIDGNGLELTCSVKRRAGGFGGV